MTTLNRAAGNKAAGSRTVPLRPDPGSRREKIEIREATVLDNEPLLALTKATPMAGTISLRIDRDPDFFALLRARGNPIVYVAAYAGQIIGCMSASVHLGYIAGVAERVAHVGDLKVHPRFSGTRIALRLITAIDVRLREEGVDLCMSLMADGNERAIRFTDGKHGTPAVVPTGLFMVDQLLPLLFRRKSQRYHVEEAQERDLPDIASFVDRLYRQKSFTPPITMQDLLPRQREGAPVAFHKTLLVRRAGTVVATLTLEDTQYLRQNVLMGAPLAVRTGLVLLRWLRFFGLRIPRLGQPIKTLYVRFMACAPGHEDALRGLITEARVHTFHQRFTFLSVGLHQRDPLRSVVAGTLRMTFVSRAMIASLAPRDRATGVTSQIPSEDFALV